MTQVDLWPYPPWLEVRVSWEWIMEHHTHSANDLYQWVLDAPGGDFHISGYGDAEGFSYRFKNAKDATWFVMNLPK